MSRKLPHISIFEKILGASIITIALIIMGLAIAIAFGFNG